VLTESLGLPLVTQAPSARYITVGLNAIYMGDNKQSSSKGKVKVNRLPTTDESYKVEAAVSPTPFISVTANTTTGVFWGTQSVLALDSDPRGIPVGTVNDGPRFPYRGVHADVCRNFQSKDAILKLIDSMAMYKLNYLQMHISDDEGWRLEIPGLPELTEVPSQPWISRN
jgi:N-acetyl-beta-hexosaminidase